MQCETSIDALTVTESHAAQGPSACNGITISQTTFLAGMIDGKIHAENSAFRSVLFARHAPTSLDMWNVDVGLSVMCDQQVDVRLDARSGIACTSCDTVETVTACRLDNAPELIANPCRAFEGKLRACEPPLPARRSPYVTMPPRLGK